LKAARDEAGQHVDAARLAAEKIRRESERELQAATARRDAITAQLTNVRQMLATLGGVTIVNPLADPEPAAAAPQAAVASEEQSEAQAEEEAEEEEAEAAAEAEGMVVEESQE
ncbi:MAG: hypothetical protein WAL91_00070, partial [Propionicimonas sp.]